MKTPKEIFRSRKTDFKVLIGKQKKPSRLELRNLLKKKKGE